MLLRFRRALWAQLDPPTWPTRGLSPLNLIVCIVIVLGTAAAILETEPTISAGHERLFHWLEIGFGTVFALEYLGRLWTIAEDDPAHPWRRRLRFVLSPGAILDLFVLTVTFAPMFVLNPQMLRLLRLVRIIRLAKLGRMSSAMQHLFDAVASRRLELGLTGAIALFLLVAGATLLYWLEGEIQPDHFGSIPRSLWWAVVTLTTIGYGDAVPVTVAGKFVAAAMAVCGIGLIAMPTGILAAAFSDAMERSRAAEARAIRSGETSPGAD